MTERKHTPGPWRVGYKTLHVMAKNAKIGGDTPICDIRGWGYLTGNGHGALGLSPDEAADIQNANARMIAAAPDMLDALKYVAERIRGSDEWWMDCPDKGGFDLDLIESAIAKAEGK